MENNESNIIIYNTIDGKASVVLYAHDGSVWMNKLAGTSHPDVVVPGFHNEFMKNYLSVKH